TTTGASNDTLQAGNLYPGPDHDSQQPRVRGGPRRRRPGGGNAAGDEGVADLSRLRRAGGQENKFRGLGLAPPYITQQLKSWGIKPGGDAGSYFQRVRVLGVKSTNNSTVTVEAAGGTRTFKNGEGVQFQGNVGSKRTIAGDQIEFMGYGFNASAAGYNDYQGK